MTMERGRSDKPSLSWYQKFEKKREKNSVSFAGFDLGFFLEVLFIFRG